MDTTGTMTPITEISGQLSTSETLHGSLAGAEDVSGDLTIPETSYIPYELPPATTGTLGGVIIGDDILVTPEGRISVDKATSPEEDNTRPITAAAVYTEIGNINALLSTI